MKDKIFINEKNNALQVLIKMETIIPCIRAIQQYNPQFKPTDIANERKNLYSNIYETIRENFTDYLYTLIDEENNALINTEPQPITKRDSKSVYELEQLEMDLEELEL